MDRYSRHNLIDWFSQDEVSKKSVCVIGAGAVGNEVLKSLVLLGVGKVTVFDFDTIEEHNLTKSVLFRSTDIGRSKAEVASLHATELDPNVQVVAVHGDATRLLKMSELRKMDVVISCVDNFEARLRINQMCRIAGVDFLNLGIDSKYASIEIFPFSNENSVACYECNLPLSVYDRIAERYSCGHLRKISFEEKKIPTTIVTSGIAGSFGASVALRLGNTNLTDSKRMLIDTISGHSTVTNCLTSSPDCPCCASIGTKFQIVCASRKGGFGNVFQKLGSWPALDLRLRLNEPVVLSSVCKKCGSSPYSGAQIGRAQHELDESARFCSNCADHSVDIQFGDELTVDLFARLYINNPIPIAYVTTNIGDLHYCFSFEEDL
jgi:molybdopterin/thiamine biosynthesis adenylyltransferase